MALMIYWGSVAMNLLTGDDGDEELGLYVIAHQGATRSILLSYMQASYNIVPPSNATL